MSETADSSATADPGDFSSAPYALPKIRARSDLDVRSVAGDGDACAWQLKQLFSQMHLLHYRIQAASLRQTQDLLDENARLRRLIAPGRGHGEFPADAKCPSCREAGGLGSFGRFRHTVACASEHGGDGGSRSNTGFNAGRSDPATCAERDSKHCSGQGRVTWKSDTPPRSGDCCKLCCAEPDHSVHAPDDERAAPDEVAVPRLHPVMVREPVHCGAPRESLYSADVFADITVAAEQEQSQVSEPASYEAAGTPSAQPQAFLTYSMTAQSLGALRDSSPSITGARANSEALELTRCRQRIANRILGTGDVDIWDDDIQVQAVSLQRALQEQGWEDLELEHLNTIMRSISNAIKRYKEDAHIRNFGVLSRSARRAVLKVHTHGGEVRASVRAGSRFLPRTTAVFDDAPPTISLTDLLDAFFHPDLRRFMSRDAYAHVETMRTLLSSGNILTIIAESTKLSVIELAAPPPKPSFVEYMEPPIAAFIVLNGLLIGVQCEASLRDWPGWYTIEVLFVILFFCEMLVRMWSSGLPRFFCGPEAGWNIMDFLIVNASMLETFTEASWSSNILRIARLARLSRLLRVLRIRAVQDLTVMLRGLLGGFRTLSWAMVLLLATLYVISVFMHTTLWGSERVFEIFGKEDASRFFSSVPRCMFTAFRCFTGECTDEGGVSMVAVLSKEFGLQFELPYTMAVMLVNFGICNLIIGVYIEATMEASKQAANPEKGRSHSLSLANLLKTLVKRVAMLHRVQYDRKENIGLVRSATAHEHEDVNEDISISKELFMKMLQDPVVQNTLDKLDVPFNRAHLFDVLDSDGSGMLNVSELVTGLLVTRGEPRKSDTVACLISIRAMQGDMAEFRERVYQSFEDVKQISITNDDVASTKMSWQDALARTDSCEDYERTHPGQQGNAILDMNGESEHSERKDRHFSGLLAVLPTESSAGGKRELLSL